MDALRTQLESINHNGAIKVSTRHTLGELVIPQEIELEEAEGDIWIKYHYPVSGKTKSPSGALANFLTLANEPITRDHFLKFAQQWGVLCICPHNLIASHGRTCIPRCDEPLYSQFQSYLEHEEDLLDPVTLKMYIAEVDVWFREPLWVWCQYAQRMKALINIFQSIRGERHSNTLDDWRILRQIEMPAGNHRMQSIIERNESVAGTPIQQCPFDQQCRVLGNILSMWMGETCFFPHLEWTFPGANTSYSQLAAQCTLNATYSDVNLFNSDYLTLFSVLVVQCISALGPDPFFRHCNCIGCGAHKGNCQELIELSLTPGRPSAYCDLCKPYIRQRQKSASRKKIIKERGNYHG